MVSRTSSQETTTKPGTNEEQDFQAFLKNVKSLSGQEGFIDVSDPSGRQGVFVTLAPVAGHLVYKLVVDCDFTWKLFYKERLVSKNSHVLKNHPEFLCENSFHVLLQSVKQSCICIGHGDFQELLQHCEKNGEKFLYNNNRSIVVGYIQDNLIRSVNCCILLPEGTVDCCESCRQFRPNLRARLSHIRTNSQKSTDRTSANSKVPISKLSDEEKSERIRNLSKCVNSLQKKSRTKLVKMVAKQSVAVDEEQNEMLAQFVSENRSVVEDAFPHGSPERTFWDQQLKINRLKNSKGMRWHPVIIKWCISLYSKSPRAYEQLAKAGFVKLPSKNTLKSYLKFTESVPDVNTDILELVYQQFENQPEFKRNVSLVWDEVKIKSGLAVSKKTGKLIGFCHSDSIDTDSDENDVATHILVLMVRGIMTRVNLPFIWYPCKNLSSFQLLGVVWKATKLLEHMDLKVRAWVCDGASSNRTFYNLHCKMGQQFAGVTYCTMNRYGRPRYIYYICDVPHLLKTVRNNLENSHGNHNSKNLVKSGRTISWSHIVSTVDADKRMQLSRLFKIKEEHVHLSPQLRMRVKLAAQVLSSSMSNAIIARNLPSLKGTAEFCDYFDKWFDCLNGRYLNEGTNKRKPNLEPYSNLDDPRFVWLENDFMQWLLDWETEVQSVKDLTKSERNRLLMSRQTMDGLKITTHAFVHLAKILLSEPGAEFLLPEKLNQDRLETFFGKVRRGCGDSDNPTVEQARHRILAIIVAGQAFISPKNMNCLDFAEDTGHNPMCKKLKRKK